MIKSIRVFALKITLIFFFLLIFSLFSISVVYAAPTDDTSESVTHDEDEDLGANTKGYGDNKGFEGWTEEMRESAWMTYAMTEWNEYGTFDFSSDGVFYGNQIDENGGHNWTGDKWTTGGISSDIYKFSFSWNGDDSTRTTPSGICDEICTGTDNASAYTNLLLCIVYELNKEGSTRSVPTADNEQKGILQNTDIAYTYYFLEGINYSAGDDEINPYSESCRTPYKSVEIIYNTLLERISAFSRINGYAVSLSNKDDGNLGIIIQSIIYGEGYIEWCAENDVVYTCTSLGTGTANDYWKGNKSTIKFSPKFNKFAKNVLNNFTVIGGGDAYALFGNAIPG